MPHRKCFFEELLSGTRRSDAAARIQLEQQLRAAFVHIVRRAFAQEHVTAPLDRCIMAQARHIAQGRRRHWAEDYEQFIQHVAERLFHLLMARLQSHLRWDVAMKETVGFSSIAQTRIEP